MTRRPRESGGDEKQANVPAGEWDPITGGSCLARADRHWVQGQSGGTGINVCLLGHRRWRVLSVLALYWIRIEGLVSWNVATLYSKVNC